MPVQVDVDMEVEVEVDVDVDGCGWIWMKRARWKKRARWMNGDKDKIRQDREPGLMHLSASERASERERHTTWAEGVGARQR